MFVHTRTESYSRHAEGITMECNGFSTDLESFIDNVLEPSESFARLCQKAYDNVMLDHGIKAEFMDIAQISGALTSLTRYRLQEFANKLKEQVGPVAVIQPRGSIAVDYQVTQVQIGEKRPETPKQ